MTDAQRQSLSITVRSTTRTLTGAPTSKPVAQVDTSQRLRHTISFVDEMTPTSRAKPDGVQGCEIWIKIGEPAPTGPADFKYLATDTRSPYLVEFDAADAGKTTLSQLEDQQVKGRRGGSCASSRTQLPSRRIWRPFGVGLKRPSQVPRCGAHSAGIR